MCFYWRSFHTSSNMLASSAAAAYLRPHLKGETFLRHQSPSLNVSIWPPTRCFTSHNSSHRSGGSRRRPGGNRWGDNVWKTSLTRSVCFYFTCWRISPERNLSVFLRQIYPLETRLGLWQPKLTSQCLFFARLALCFVIMVKLHRSMLTAVSL